MSSAPAAHAAPAKFGEVVESSIERLIGQCHVLYGAPPLGSLVRAGEDIFAIVSGVSAAALRQAAPCFPEPRAFLMSACRAVAAQLPADAARLAAIMRRLPLDETE